VAERSALLGPRRRPLAQAEGFLPRCCPANSFPLGWQRRVGKGGHLHQRG
jgi:hypothetical protein